eukprot:SAG22_NODE_628_length_8398_cov_6.714905_6_plen_278_part_00
MAFSSCNTSAGLLQPLHLQHHRVLANHRRRVQQAQVHPARAGVPGAVRNGAVPLPTGAARRQGATAGLARLGRDHAERCAHDSGSCCIVQLHCSVWCGCTARFASDHPPGRHKESDQTCLLAPSITDHNPRPEHSRIRMIAGDPAGYDWNYPTVRAGAKTVNYIYALHSGNSYGSFVADRIQQALHAGMDGEHTYDPSTHQCCIPIASGYSPVKQTMMTAFRPQAFTSTSSTVRQRLSIFSLSLAHSLILGCLNEDRCRLQMPCPKSPGASSGTRTT